MHVADARIWCLVVDESIAENLLVLIAILCAVTDDVNTSSCSTFKCVYAGVNAAGAVTDMTVQPCAHVLTA